MTTKRPHRVSESGRDKCATKAATPRSSRAGKDAHRSHNYVRHAGPAEAVDDEPEIEEPARRASAVTVPPMRFLARKKIAGELI